MSLVLSCLLLHMVTEKGAQLISAMSGQPGQCPAPLLGALLVQGSWIQGPAAPPWWLSFCQPGGGTQKSHTASFWNWTQNPCFHQGAWCAARQPLLQGHWHSSCVAAAQMHLSYFWSFGTPAQGHSKNLLWHLSLRKSAPGSLALNYSLPLLKGPLRIYTSLWH